MTVPTGVYWTAPSTSPLGSPVPAEATAFPMESRSASAGAPSIRLNAMRRPFSSQTVTLTFTSSCRAFAIAASTIEVASARISVTTRNLPPAFPRTPIALIVPVFGPGPPFALTRIGAAGEPLRRGMEGEGGRRGGARGGKMEASEAAPAAGGEGVLEGRGGGVGRHGDEGGR